jgi:hypothetical protein
MGFESLAVHLKYRALIEETELTNDQIGALTGREPFRHNPGIRSPEEPPSCEKPPQPMLERLEPRS